MAKGNFRIDDRICLFCGFDAMNDEKKHLPFMFGKGANKVYLCKTCAGKIKREGLKMNPHTDYKI